MLAIGLFYLALVATLYLYFFRRSAPRTPTGRRHHRRRGGPGRGRRWRPAGATDLLQGSVGEVVAPGGTVTYHAYAGANTCSGTDLFGSGGAQVTVSNGVVPDSPNISFQNAGTYSFQAVYSGDTKNNGATSVCSR